MLVPLQGASVRVACALERACWCCCRCLCQSDGGAGMLVPLLGAAAGCRCKAPLQGAAVRGVLWSGHAGAAVKERGVCALERVAAGCCVRVLLCCRVLQGAALRVGASKEACWCRFSVPLQGCLITLGGAAARVVVYAGAAAGCRCKDAADRTACALLSWLPGPLQGAAAWCLRVLLLVVCALCSWLAGAAAGRLRVLLSDWRVRFGGGLLVPVQGAAQGAGVRENHHHYQNHHYDNRRYHNQHYNDNHRHHNQHYHNHHDHNHHHHNHHYHNQPLSQLPLSQPPLSQPPLSQPPLSQPPRLQPPLSPPPQMISG